MAMTAAVLVPGYSTPTNTTSNTKVPLSTKAKTGSYNTDADEAKMVAQYQASLKKNPSIAPKTTAKTTTAAPSGSGGGAATGGGGGGIGGGPVVSPSMQALEGPGVGVDGGGMDGATGMLSSPNRFRQGIGQRMMPQESASLAALRKVY